MGVGTGRQVWAHQYVHGVVVVVVLVRLKESGGVGEDICIAHDVHQGLVFLLEDCEQVPGARRKDIRNTSQMTRKRRGKEAG